MQISQDCLRALPIGKFVRFEQTLIQERMGDIMVDVIVWAFRDIHTFNRIGMFDCETGFYCGDTSYEIIK